MITNSSKYRKSILFVVSILILDLSGCATTHKTRSAKQSGFLGDYSEFEKSKKGKNQPNAFYYAYGKDFNEYTKLIVEPFTLWLEDERELSAEDRDQLQELANYLHVRLVEELKQDYSIVKIAGAGVLRLRVAITEAKGASVILDFASTLTPYVGLVSTAKRFTTGTELFVGRAAIELEMLDALSNRRIIAAIEGRSGTKTLHRGFSEWKELKNAIDYWAKNLRKGLAKTRKTT